MSCVQENQGDEGSSQSGKALVQVSPQLEQKDKGGEWTCRSCGKVETDGAQYNRRFKVCETCKRASSVSIDGATMRFCQKCSKFQHVSLFDGERRNCRERLARNNELRRQRKQAEQKDQQKTQPPCGNQTQEVTKASTPSSDNEAQSFSIDPVDAFKGTVIAGSTSNDNNPNTINTFTNMNNNSNNNNLVQVRFFPCQLPLMAVFGVQQQNQQQQQQQQQQPNKCSQFYPQPYLFTEQERTVLLQNRCNEQGVQRNVVTTSATKCMHRYEPYPCIQNQNKGFQQINSCCYNSQCNNGNNCLYHNNVYHNDFKKEQQQQQQTCVNNQSIVVPVYGGEQNFNTICINNTNITCNESNKQYNNNNNNQQCYNSTEGSNNTNTNNNNKSNNLIGNKNGHFYNNANDHVFPINQDSNNKLIGMKNSTSESNLLQEISDCMNDYYGMDDYSGDNSNDNSRGNQFNLDDNMYLCYGSYQTPSYGNYVPCEQYGQNVQNVHRQEGQSTLVPSNTKSTKQLLYQFCIKAFGRQPSQLPIDLVSQLEAVIGAGFLRPEFLN